MGILNITPDSFSDGAELASADSTPFRFDPDKVRQRAQGMVAAGAQILDVGGESTRPGAAAVALDEELARTIPVLELLRAEFDILLSIDTSSPEVMRAAIAAGADLVNDIRALSNEGALAVAAEGSAPPAVCLMHMQGQPRTMQQTYAYDDVVGEVVAFLQRRVADCEAAGIERNRIMIDPGFGFGKSVAHNYALLKHLPGLQQLDLPILVGISRKSMIGAVTGRPVDQRLAGSIAATTLALQAGAHVVRTHDVEATVDAIRIYQACAEA
jgi:dihydropteroate synthase